LCRGGTLEIEAAGVLHDVIASGAKVDLTVKYGLITLIRESFDMCENAGQVDLECPVSDGKRILKKSVDIPKQVPPVCSPNIFYCSLGELPVTALANFPAGKVHRCSKRLYR
jgi:hypothetical protein